MSDTREPTQLEQAGLYFDIWRLNREPRHLNEAAIRALCYNAYLGNDMSVCRVLGRYRMFADTKDIGFSTFLLTDGYWEMWTTEAMLRYLQPGMTALDIGANLGYFTMLMADVVGATGKVLSFEPVPRTATRLRHSVHINGFAGYAQVHEIGLAGQEGEVTMFMPEGEPKNAHFSQPIGREGEIAVPVRRADTIPGALDADFIKIDVEGAEEQVWVGMEGILQRQRPLTIFLEYTSGRYHDPERFLEEILSHGFSLGRIDFSEGVQQVTRESVLAWPAHEDQMLVLSR